MEESSLVQQLSLAMDNIRRAEKIMKKAINAEVEPIFLLLHFAEVSKGGSVPVSAMKDAMCVSAAAATQFIKKLESYGYVSRQADEQDRRMVMISLTEAGKAKVESTQSVFGFALAGLIRDLGTEDTKAFIELLNRTSVYLEKEYTK